MEISNIISGLALLVSFGALLYSRLAYKRQSDHVGLEERKHKTSILPEFRNASDPQHDHIPDRQHSLEFNKRIQLSRNRALSIHIKVIEGCRFERLNYDVMEPEDIIYYVLDFPIIAKQKVDMFKICFYDIDGNPYIQTAIGNHGFVELSLPKPMKSKDNKRFRSS